MYLGKREINLAVQVLRKAYLTKEVLCLIQLIWIYRHLRIRKIIRSTCHVTISIQIPFNFFQQISVMLKWKIVCVSVIPKKWNFLKLYRKSPFTKAPQIMNKLLQVSIVTIGCVKLREHGRHHSDPGLFPNCGYIWRQRIKYGGNMGIWMSLFWF